MHRNSNRRPSTVASPGRRLLGHHVDVVRRRDLSFDAAVDAVRAGDEDALAELVRRAQRGDHDGAVAAIWALLPRLSAVIISRLPTHRWQDAVDDYVTVVYLTILDVDPSESTDHLSDKIIARTRRRVERSWRTGQDRLCRPGTLDVLAPPQNDVEARVLARTELEALVDAVGNGLIAADAWSTMLRLRFAAAPGTPTARERKVASRARSRLHEWADRNAA